MTYILDMRAEGAIIATDMSEWRERFPPLGEKSQMNARITFTWKYGDQKLPADAFPKNLIAQKSRKSWPDMFETTNGLRIASGRAKDIIDTLDPGLHQFFPLTIHTKRGLEVEGPWFAMNVTEEQDSVVIEKSRAYLPAGSSSNRLHDFIYQYKDVTVDPSRVNLWREHYFMGSLLASDALFDALKAADLKFYRRFKAKTL